MPGISLDNPSGRSAFRMAQAIDVMHVDECLKAALGLLKATYTATPHGGGWHHRLADPKPAATATAIALTAFHEQQVGFANFDAGLSFLRASQVASDDPLQDGGWWTETQARVPLMEATGWVARFLGHARLHHAEGGPDVGRALSWLINNQNDDGGWGSHRGCRSRVWLTCLGLRALNCLHPRHKAVADGVNWLLRQQDEGNFGWSANAGEQTTVPHTSFVLLTLSEINATWRDQRLLRAYSWLCENVDPTIIDGSIESYHVSPYPNSRNDDRDRDQGWDQVIYHHALPIALSALLRHPDGPPAGLVTRAANTIIRSQITEDDDRRFSGYWPGQYTSKQPTLWSTWPCMQALLDLKRVPLLRAGDITTWSREAVVVQRGSARDRSPAAILRAHHRKVVLRSRLTRHWPSGLVVVSVGAGGLAVGLGGLGMKEFALSLIFPFLLFVVEQRRRNGRKNREAKGRPGRRQSEAV
ncbi:MULTISPECIES: prenyltransferase/squalene oxidase repeat-containing protein [unclassified Nonomuraea]|uniref:prenyltransferase/squalene oxidase repeat-containing protein n=1 Tax=unclassified Nonomuraea TaxID=2593643 RepID=UPI0035BFAA55